MDLVFYLFNMGIIVEAMSGALAAGEKNMDFFGVIVIAAVTGVGGGTVRDVLLGEYPLMWVHQPFYLLCTTVAAIVTIFTAGYIKKVHKLFLVLDAIGLAAFSIYGTEKGIDLGLHPFLVVVIAMVTGIAGGMLRDVLCNNEPLVFKKELYAVVAIIASVLYQCMLYADIRVFGIEVLTLLFALSFRLAAIKWHIKLPSFVYKHDS